MTRKPSPAVNPGNNTKHKTKKIKEKEKMAKYVFNEVRGKCQGEIIIVEAETPEEAINKVRTEDGEQRFTKRIKPWEKFSFKEFRFPMFEVYEMGKPWNSSYIVC